MNNRQALGRCSICGGTVSVPAIWYGTVPPVPQCESCGAVKAAPSVPVIEMQPRPTMQLRTNTYAGPECPVSHSGMCVAEPWCEKRCKHRNVKPCTSPLAGDPTKEGNGT